MAAIQVILTGAMATLRRLATIVGLLIAVVGVASGKGWSLPRAHGIEPKPAAAPRLAVIILENREYMETVGNPDAPFLDRLTRRGALATRYFAVSHPSLPNYLAMIGGSTFGIQNDCTDCWASGDNLAAQMSRSRISWRAYMEDMPEPCYAGPTYQDYAKRHDPFMYFGSIAAVPSRCRNVVPGTQLDQDLRRGRLPTFSWITPNVCHDAHDCSLATTDRWLSELVPRIIRNLGTGGILILTFDEGSSESGCCRGSRGGRVMTLFVGPGARRGVRLTRPFDHYSLLATIEHLYRLPRIRNARSAPVMHGGVRRVQLSG